MICSKCGFFVSGNYCGNCNSFLEVEEQHDPVLPTEPIKAQRFNSKKVDTTTIHPAMIMYLLRVGAKGAKKYSKGNYLKGSDDASEYIASAFRHLLKVMGGEFIDPETNEPHGAHAAWNMLMLCWAVESGLSPFTPLDTKDMELFNSLFNIDRDIK